MENGKGGNWVIISFKIRSLLQLQLQTISEAKLEVDIGVVKVQFNFIRIL